ncbi:MAG: hypothetical protein RL220_2012 [Bacteroidota bacterium]|jgi:hypothetical protein
MRFLPPGQYKDLFNIDLKLAFPAFDCTEIIRIVVTRFWKENNVKPLSKVVV